MDELYKQVKALFDAYHYPAHDFKHVKRVSVLAKQIAISEDYDVIEAEIAGLLHDVGRTVKDNKLPHAHIGVPIAKELLDKYTQLSEDTKLRILSAIEHHSDLTTDGELQHILQDADKLDGMGAIGIARSYISLHFLPDYIEDKIIPTSGEYNNFKSIHELIVLEMHWFDMLYTDSAKRLGKPRYEFMKYYLEEIKREIIESF